MSDIKKIKKILFTLPSLCATTLPVVLTSCNSNTENGGEGTTINNINIGGELEINSTVYLSKTEVLRKYLEQEEFALETTTIDNIISNISRYFTIEYPSSGNAIKYTATRNAFWYQTDNDKLINKLNGSIEVSLNYTPSRTLRSLSMATTTQLNMISGFSTFFGSQQAAVSSQIVDVKLEIDEENSLTNNATIEKTSTLGVFNISYADDSVNDKVIPLIITYTLNSGEVIKLKSSHYSFGTQTIGLDDIFVNKAFDVTIDLDSPIEHDDILDLLISNCDIELLSSINLPSETLISQLYSSTNSFFSISNNKFQLTSILSSLTYSIVQAGVSRNVNINLNCDSPLIFNFSLTYTVPSSSSLTTDSTITPPSLNLSSIFSFMNYDGSNSATYSVPSSQTITSMSSVSTSSFAPMVYDSGSNILSFNETFVNVLEENSIVLQYNNCIFNVLEHDSEMGTTTSTAHASVNLPITVTATPAHSLTSRSFTARYSQDAASTSGEYTPIELTTNSSISNILKKSISNATAYDETLHLPSYGSGLVNNSGLNYSASSSIPTVTKNAYSSKSWLFLNTQSLYSDRAIDTGGDVGYTTNYNFSLEISSVEVTAEIESPNALYQYLVANGKTTSGASLRELTNAQPTNVSKPSINFKGSYNASINSTNTIDNSTLVNATLASNLAFDYTFVDQTATTNPVINLTTNTGATNVVETKTTNFSNAFNYLSFPEYTQSSIKTPVETGFLIETSNGNPDSARVRDVNADGTYGEWRIPWWPKTSTLGTSANSTVEINSLTSQAGYTNSIVCASKALIPNYDKYNFGLNNKPTDVNLTTDINFDATNYGKVDILLEDSNHTHYSLFDSIYVYLKSNGEPEFKVNSNLNLSFQVSFYNPIDRMSVNGTYEQYTINNIPTINKNSASVANWNAGDAAAGNSNSGSYYLNWEWDGDFDGSWEGRQGVDGADRHGFFPNDQTLSSFVVTDYSVLQSLISHETKTLSLPFYTPAANDYTTIASNIFQFSKLFS